MIILIFGVSGAGKTTVGKLVAEQLGWAFYDADDFHSPENIAKMKRGIPLNDEDREPWLQKLHEQIAESDFARENAVVACSALKKAYRDKLRAGIRVQFVFLEVDRDQVERQLRGRHGHFMNPALLDSQFADLEKPSAPEKVWTVPPADTAEATARAIISKIETAKLS